MVSYKDLKSLFEMTLEWEKQLSDFYDVAEYALKKKETQLTIVLLKENHENNLKILREIDVESFGKDEWLKYVPDYSVKDLIPIGKITRKSNPDEIIDSILEYEERIKDFYSFVAQKIVSRDEKELFESLVSFKNAQIVRIKQLLEFL